MPTKAPPRGDRVRRRIVLTGCVQGVGLRPFLFRLARELALGGFVQNTSAGVVLEVEGEQHGIDAFCTRLRDGAPPPARIYSAASEEVAAAGAREFAIRESSPAPLPGTVLPDLATCSECVKEIFDPANRRYRYPFTNCTHCGPRYSIIERVPYDRENTSMQRFAMCGQCAAEYADPSNRRFHAQANACAACGPRLEYWNSEGTPIARAGAALEHAVAAIRCGRIVAVKGLGGFHLLADAECEDTVARLRRRKHRDEKPFALMFPSLEQVRAQCRVSDLEAELLASAVAPIVLLERQPSSRLPSSLAPKMSNLGVMLPYTPLHHLLLREINKPVVATSGNACDEPICIDEFEALRRLAGIADGFLIHDRPIVRHVDDSIVRAVAGREMVLRRARGYAPLPVRVGKRLPSIIAYGAHLKNSIAISRGDEVILSPHIGDLDTPEARGALEAAVRDLPRLFEHQAEVAAADLHPEYASTRLAQPRAPRPVQHHYAHILSCMAENGIDAPLLGVAWDGTGLGSDGTIWGGEFLAITSTGFTRFAHLRPFTLPGGDAAAREPRRSALALLYEVSGKEVFEMSGLPPLESFTSSERTVLQTMLRQKVNTPTTTSVGRLCDAVSSLLDLCQRSSYEGQAALMLEAAIDGMNTQEQYAMPLSSGVVDWEPALRQIISDLRDKVPAAMIAAKFHNALAESILTVAHASGQRAVALSGGCFQNKYLAERAVRRLRESGFTPYWHRLVPPNDGGIALGQVMAVARES